MFFTKKHIIGLMLLTVVTMGYKISVFAESDEIDFESITMEDDSSSDNTLEPVAEIGAEEVVIDEDKEQSGMDEGSDAEEPTIEEEFMEEEGNDVDDDLAVEDDWDSWDEE